MAEHTGIDWTDPTWSPRRRLTVHQLRCLYDMGNGPLVRSRAGWSLWGGTYWHDGRTVDALARRGCCTITDRHRIGKGEARITNLGLTLRPAVRPTA